MNNKNLPTMFIDTVSTKIDNKNTQVYYDSRYKTSNSKWTTSKPKSVIEKKLDGILNLVSKGNISSANCSKTFILITSFYILFSYILYHFLINFSLYLISFFNFKNMPYNSYF